MALRSWKFPRKMCRAIIPWRRKNRRELRSLDGRQNFRRVPLGRHFVPDFADGSIRADPESHAHDSQKRFSEKTFHAPRAVGFDYAKFRVRQQRKIEFVLGLEIRLRRDGIRAAADHGRVEFLELREGVTKLGRFVGSTGSIGLREKE